MEWHQPWMLSLNPRELEELLDDCRERSKANLHQGRFGLAYAWAGLAHELVERLLELYRESPQAERQEAFELELRGAYSDW